MSDLEEFYEITDTEDYFEFFDLKYDERLVYVKRFHIMKKYGEMVAKGKEQTFESDEKLLEFYKFALITVYKNFENGYAPSAADVWSMFDNPTACGTCSTSSDCEEEEEVTNGVHACTVQPDITFS